jgi:uncharacterized protein (DUF924 family)
VTGTLAEEILAFWFGRATADAAAAQARSKLWFRATPAFDRELVQRFGALPDRIRAGEFDAWRLAPRTALARILALDQFPRNLHRGSARAFAYDAAALAAATDALERNHDEALHPLEAVFVYLPFEHAEDAAMQARAVERFERLRARAPRALAALFDGYLDYAQRHARVIARFGRFPHRNDILGRPATAAELAYLAGGGQRF